MSANRLTLATFEPFLVNYEPRGGETEVWGCMDERPPHQDDRVLAPSLYYQTPGAIYGIAQDRAVAMEAGRSGSFTNNNQRVDELAADMHEELWWLGVDAVLHEVCAAEGAAPAIAASTAASSTSLAVLESAQQLHPLMTSSTFENISEITGRLLANGYIGNPHDAYHRLRTGSPDHAAIPSARLKDVGHDALAFLAIWKPDKCIDVYAADQQQTRAYGISMGALERLHDLLNDRYPANLDDFLGAVATRTANIQSHHLLGPDGLPLPIINDL